MTRWIALAAGAALLAGTACANAQAVFVGPPYAVAPPPALVLAPAVPAFVAPPVFVAPPPVFTRRVFVAPEFYAPLPSRRVVVTERYIGPPGFVTAGW